MGFKEAMQLKFNKHRTLEATVHRFEISMGQARRLNVTDPPIFSWIEAMTSGMLDASPRFYLSFSIPP